MKVIAVIPVKSQSKRIESKNTKLLTDRPLFIHTLDKLLEINYCLCFCTNNKKQRSR